MKTTLKRGMGRGADGNGDGRPVLPPAPPTPRSVYEQPPRKGGGLRTVGRVLGWAFVGALVLILGVAGGAYLSFHESVAAVAAHSADVKLASKRLSVPLPGQASIALVLGYDYRANETKGTPSRSDTLMLLRADPKTNSISMLSLPRDLYVEIHCPGKPTFHSKINAAYAYCGAKGAVATVESLTGLPINYLITVNFRGFKQIVDQVGGVWMDVDQRYFNDVSGPNGYATINLYPGYQRLSGSDALDYVRFRHTDSDFIRVERQQQFVKALKAQIGQAISPLGLPKLIGAITRNVEVGVGGGGQLSGRTVLSYGLFAYGLPNGHFFQSRIQGLTGYSDVLASQDAVLTAVHDFINPDVSAASVATASALGEKPKPKKHAAAPAAPPASQTTITVLNGNGVAGAAANAAYLLGTRGYRVVGSGNGPQQSFNTTVYFDGGQPGSKAAATGIAKLFGGADVKPLQPDLVQLSQGAMVVTVVGQTFHNTLAPPVEATAPQIPKREPPRVLANTYTASSMQTLVRQAQHQVPYRLMTPTLVDSGSVASSAMPIRVYDIVPHQKAVRLVFRNGGGQYWGVQETRYANLPVLRGSNERRILGGRIYDLYYSGPHLHMVVLRWGGNTYWVVNTLQDQLTNETMLAIAKGLRPVHG